MNALLVAAQEMCDFMAGRKWSFCVIGGLAVQKWGEPRTTLDADLVLFTGWGNEKNYIDEILKHFPARFPGAAEFAMDRRVLLVRASNGKDLDILLGALEFEKELTERSRPVEFAPGVLLRCCTAEDLFVMKAFAGRARDWSDAESVVARQPNLDQNYVLSHLSKLCALKDDTETLERARVLLSQEL